MLPRFTHVVACVSTSFLFSCKDFFFLDVDHFQSLYWICYNTVLVLSWPFDLEKCGIPVPQPGMEPTHPEFRR